MSDATPSAPPVPSATSWGRVTAVAAGSGRPRCRRIAHVTAAAAVGAAHAQPRMVGPIGRAEASTPQSIAVAVPMATAMPRISRAPVDVLVVAWRARSRRHQ